MTPRILSVESLTVVFDTPFGEVTAVDDVSFDLVQGEALGIVGESGSGKTVTCRSLLGLLPPTARVSGRIDVEGANVVSLAPRDLAALRGRKMSMVFQNPSNYLDPLMRVGEQIGEGLRFHLGLSRGAARRRSVELLEQVRIAHPERRVRAYPHELSGGMKQRVMIAGAIGSQPQTLIADEPTTGLDVTVQARILELLKQLREQEHLSLILVSHDLAVIASTCDRVIVMKDGRIVEEGPTREILLRPSAAYTRELVASNPGLDLRKALISRRGASVVADSSQPVLVVENLSVTFGRARGRLSSALLGQGAPPVRAVEEVSFSLREGEILGLVGESGSGKTTIGRAIVGLTEPSAGRVLFDERGLGDGRGKQRNVRPRTIQMVFQDPYASLNPRLTAQETIAEPLRRHHLCHPDQIEERVRELMTAVELRPSLATRRPHELSGGQCQRVAIARALTVEPRLLIADEITSALDVTIQKQILNLLRKLREELNLTIIFISHDLGVVQELCDYIAVMRSGRLVEYGTTDEILFNPREDYTKELLAAVPRMPAPVEHALAAPSATET